MFDVVTSFPTATWGRDEQRTGEMWGQVLSHSSSTVAIGHAPSDQLETTV